MDLSKIPNIQISWRLWYTTSWSKIYTDAEQFVKFVNDHIKAIKQNTNDDIKYYYDELTILELKNNNNYEYYDKLCLYESLNISCYIEKWYYFD